MSHLKQRRQKVNSLELDLKELEPRTRKPALAEPTAAPQGSRAAMLLAERLVIKGVMSPREAVLLMREM